MQAVVDHLWTNFGYVTDLVIGHSRGAIIAFRWIATSVYGQQVSAFVNVSGRYRMEVRRLQHYHSVDHLINCERKVENRW